MIPYPFHQVHNSIGDYRRQRMDVSPAYFCRMKTSRENTRYCLLNFRYKGSRVVTMVWIWISVRTYEATDAVARCFTHARWSGFCRTPRACKKNYSTSASRWSAWWMRYGSYQQCCWFWILNLISMFYCTEHEQIGPSRFYCIMFC